VEDRLEIAPEALARGQPVVALETRVGAHGLPPEGLAAVPGQIAAALANPS